MTISVDWLIATGSRTQSGPQFIAASSSLALARALTDLGHKSAILAIDRQADPARVEREISDGIPVFFSALPASTLPALRIAIGQPRVLVLPNLLTAYGATRTYGLDLTAWLGEDDLACLAERHLPDDPLLLADSPAVAATAARLTQQAVPVLTPPLTEIPGLSGPDRRIRPAASAVVAVIGARPVDGIDLVLCLALQRRDLRFIVVEWPQIDEGSRARLFEAAASCGNIDWRRPASPAALVESLMEATVILAPAMQPVGHRDWQAQAGRLGKPVLRSHFSGEHFIGELFGNAEQSVSADATIADWQGALEKILAMAASGGEQVRRTRPSSGEHAAGETAAQLLAYADLRGTRRP
ncbi:MAG: hypothetical protein E6Q98_16430 [Rhodospirillaceae bacterium]|nr:MAG: hypothetical protein E6Q98_16430 [Rhodospirillaceae bacterium]